MVSVRRVAPVLLFAVTIPAWAADTQQAGYTQAQPAAKSSTKPAPKAESKAARRPSKGAAKSETKTRGESSSRPPRALHFIADHWTAWYPPDPATYPPNAKTYTIKGGDTLSGIAQQMYGSANLWPQLWESNTWITDAHWIYPGDVLLVQGETSAAAVGTQTTTTTATGTEVTTGTTAGGPTLTGGQAMTRQPEQTAQPGGITAAEIRRETPPVPLGGEADVYCYGYIGDPNEPMPNAVASFEDPEVRSEPSEYMGPQTGGSSGDLIFVNGGTATGLTAGETYMVIEPGDLILHPRTGQTIGQHYNYQGQVRILCAEETRSRAMITQNCREIHIGARLKPMPQLPIPIARIPEPPAFCDLPTGRSTGYIIDSQDWDLGLANGNLVQVNLGHDDQIQPGDFLTVYRDSDVPGYPRQVLGEIGILTTQSHTATGRIVATRRAMQVGDSVEAR